jgi:hypothetical protein
VVGASVEGGAAVVVVGAALPDPLPHPEATNRNTSTTACFLTASVCHLSPEGGAGDIGAPRCRYAQAS